MYETEQFAQAAILLAILTTISFFSTSNPYLLLLVSGVFMLFFTARSLSEKAPRYARPVQLLLSIAYIAVAGNAAAYLILYEFRGQYSTRGWMEDGMDTGSDAANTGQFWISRHGKDSIYLDVANTGQSRTHGWETLRLLFPSAGYLVVSFAVAASSTAVHHTPLLRANTTLTALPSIAFSIDIPHSLLTALLLLTAAFLLTLTERLAIHFLTTKCETAQVVSMTALAELYEKKLNQELVMKNYLADKNARLEERENISRNIHNSVGHSVTAAIMALDAAELLLDTDTGRAREKILAANRRIHTGLDSIRQAVRILDNENNFLPVGDFISQVKELAENFMTDTALQIQTDTLDIPPNLLLPREYGEFLTGAVSELLTNGVRHGNADIFIIRIAADSAHIQIRVLDNGISDFSAQNSRRKIEGGYGLKKLLSFTEKCGGSAVFENHHGFCSVITMPLYEVDTE